MTDRLTNEHPQRPWERFPIPTNFTIILLILGSRHPYPDHSEPDIGTLRYFLAALALVIFVLCIMPMPIMVG